MGCEFEKQKISAHILWLVTRNNRGSSLMMAVLILAVLAAFQVAVMQTQAALTKTTQAVRQKKDYFRALELAKAQLQKRDACTAAFAGKRLIFNNNDPATGVLTQVEMPDNYRQDVPVSIPTLMNSLILNGSVEQRYRRIPNGGNNSFLVNLEFSNRIKQTSVMPFKPTPFPFYFVVNNAGIITSCLATELSKNEPDDMVSLQDNICSALNSGFKYDPLENAGNGACSNTVSSITNEI